MPVSEVEKLLGSTGLAELIGRIKAAIAAAGAPPDGVTIDENDDGELEAVMDQEGGVTSYATHLADIVTADETTITKSEENVVGLKPGGIQPEHLSNGCVTTDKIASKAVTSDKLADGSVENRVIADGAVTPEKISDLAELRGEMGLGNTLGALPISSGGTGVTTVDDFVDAFGLNDLIDGRIESYNQELIGTYMYGRAEFYERYPSNPVPANSLGNVSCNGFEYGTSYTDTFIKPQKTGVYEVSVAYNALFYDVVFGIDSNNMDTLRGYPSVLGKTVRFNLAAGTKYYLFAMTKDNNNKNVESDFTVNMVA